MKKRITIELLPLLLATLIVASSIIISYQDWNAYLRTESDVSHSAALTRDTNDLLSNLKDAETGQRGYLLTGKESYLEPYREAVRSTRQRIDAVERSAVRTENRERLRLLRQLIEGKLQELSQTIDLYQSGRSSDALATVQSDRGKLLMDQIREVCANITNDVADPLRTEQNEVRRTVSSLRAWSALGGCALLALLILAQYTIRRATHRRLQLIRELESSRAKLSESHDLLETTLRGIGDAVISADVEGRVTFVNPVAQHLTGWTSQSAIGVPLHRVFRIINETTRATVENPVEKVIRTDRIVGLANHTILVSLDGREIPIDDSAAPIRGKNGQMAGVVLVFRDVTERRRSERILEQGRSELERSHSELQRVNADLELFAKAAGHDLQEPLRTIAGFSELVARKVKGQPETLEYLQFIQAGVQRMQAMVSALLDYSRLNADPSQLKRANLNELVGEALWNLQAAITQSGAAVTVDSMPTVPVYPQQIIQLFQNLIANAVKYRSDRRLEVHVSVGRLDGDLEGWEFSVRDNGIGMEMRYAADIFRLFRRLHNEEQYAGTGIGLAMCKRIVELHGGTIWVESELGVGSIFRFTLLAGRSSESASLVPRAD